MLGIVTFYPFRLGLVDIKGAYLQSGPIQQEIYVRPQRIEGHRTWICMAPDEVAIRDYRSWTTVGNDDRILAS